jgi:5-methylcytosine-specific restriction protein A
MPNKPKVHRAARPPRREQRPNANARGYGARWQKSSKAYLAAHPTCARCPEPATVVDHIIPHRGDMVKFWDAEGNWCPLCKRCHDRKTATEDRKR